MAQPQYGPAQPMYGPPDPGHPVDLRALIGGSRFAQPDSPPESTSGGVNYQTYAKPPIVPQGQQYSPLINPLAQSLFYQQTIGPMLQQIASETKGEQAKLGGMANTYLDSVQLPPGYKEMFKERNAQSQAQYGNLANATQAAALSAPMLDQLMNQLAQTQQAEIQRYNATGGGQQQQQNTGLPANATPDANDPTKATTPDGKSYKMTQPPIGTLPAVWSPA